MNDQKKRKDDFDNDLEIDSDEANSVHSYEQKNFNQSNGTENGIYKRYIINHTYFKLIN